MVDVVLQLEQPFDSRTEQLRMTKSIGEELIFLLRFNGNVVLVSLGMVEMAGDWSILVLFLPLLNVTGDPVKLVGSVRDEGILVEEGVSVIAEEIPALKP